MLPPPPCVAIELQAPAAAPYSVAVLAARCDAILGAGRCRVGAVTVPDNAAAPTAEDRACWIATVRAVGSAPSSATVVLQDPTQPDATSAEHAVAFRAYDASDDRWASLGLLVAALVTVAENGQRDRAATPPPETTATPAVPPAPIASATVTAHAAPVNTPVLDLRVSGLFALGLLPGLAWGGRFEVGTGNAHVAALARLSYLPMRAQTLVERQQGGEFQLTAFGLGACVPGPLQTEGPVRLCAGGDLHALAARGIGIRVAEPTTTRVYSGAAWVNASTRMPLGRNAALWFAIEGAAAILRPNFRIEGGSEIYRPSPLSGNASVGLSTSY